MSANAKILSLLYKLNTGDFTQLKIDIRKFTKLASSDSTANTGSGIYIRALTDGTIEEVSDSQYDLTTIVNFINSQLEELDTSVLIKVSPYEALVIQNPVYTLEVISAKVRDIVNGSLTYDKLFVSDYDTRINDYTITISKNGTVTVKDTGYQTIERQSIPVEQDDTSTPTVDTVDTVVESAPAKGYTEAAMDFSGNTSGRSTEDMIASIMAEAARHVANVKAGNTPELVVADDSNDVKIDLNTTATEQPSKEAIDKYVDKSMDEARDVFADKMRQSLQNARDEGFTSGAKRGDAISEDDFDFNE